VELPWDQEAMSALDDVIGSQPVLVRISAAKRLRDAAERAAREAGQTLVTRQSLDRAMSLLQGQAA
jgi:chlorophyllide a reductase subunit Z